MLPPSSACLPATHAPAQLPLLSCLTPPPTLRLPSPRASADAFGRCPLFIGGPVTKNLLHVLHRRRDVEGAMEIIEVRLAGVCLHTHVCGGGGADWGLFGTLGLAVWLTQVLCGV